MRLDLSEMVECACEALNVAHVKQADVLGHSMGGLCALALALEHPERVRRLVLVGSVSGGPAIRRGRGIPYGWSGSFADRLRPYFEESEAFLAALEDLLN